NAQCTMHKAQWATKSGDRIPCYRFMPHRTRGEGLFLCVLQKVESAEWRVESVKPLKQKRQNTASQIPKDALSWLDGEYELSYINGIITATNKHLKDFISINSNKLHVIKGLNIEIGTIKGNKVIPSHQLAMSPLLKDDAFEKCEVDYRTAIAYLRGESITINAPRGPVLITYQNAKLGFVNNLGNRANNLYPKNWRILSSHLPDNPISLVD
ncbi:MAG: rRNA cytosine-C5-methyltransferase, partial [Muribaculaceae bacterium]|nr:rRNA cytosine-C5-methyltransferase [Muribaculaceae bacterium]